jgi:hypothetical protein
MMPFLMRRIYAPASFPEWLLPAGKTNMYITAIQSLQAFDCYSSTPRYIQAAAAPNALLQQTEGVSV